MAAGNSQTTDLYNMRTEENLGESAKIFRQSFVSQYMVDFNATNALIRAGWVGTKKSTYSRGAQLLREPYVANLIRDRLRELKEDSIVTRGQVLAKMWKEANDYSNDGSVRVAATAHVAKMLGMTARVERDEGDTPQGVLMVPVANLADWGAMAQVMQTELKQRAANAIEAVEVLPLPLPR